MTDNAPNIGGYEWSMECVCGGTILATGMPKTGPDGDISWHEDRGVSITDGDTYACEWCGREWGISITRSNA